MTQTEESKKCDTRLVTRISKEDKEIIERAAALEGRSVSSFAASHLIARAREVIEESKLIRLTEAESRKLAEALSNPPKVPTPAFQKALQAYREKVSNGALQPSEAK